MKKSKYFLLIEYINNHDIIRPFEVRNFYNFKGTNYTFTFYINLLHKCYYLKRIDVGTYVKNIKVIDVKLMYLCDNYKKMKDEKFRRKHLRYLKLINLK